MMPPLLKRCPECGHVGLGLRFTAAPDGGTRRVECPSCGHRFEPGDNPWLR